MAEICHRTAKNSFSPYRNGNILNGLLEIRYRIGGQDGHTRSQHVHCK